MVAFVCECGFRAELSAEQRERLAASGGRAKCPKCGKSAKVSRSVPTKTVIDASVDDRGVDLESSGSPEFGGPSRPAWLNRRPSDNEDESDGNKNENAGAKLDSVSDDEILNTLSEPKQAASIPAERIPCRVCGEEILAVARKCKHGGEFLDETPDAAVISSVRGSDDFNNGQSVDVVRCPKCRSTQIHAEKRGWSIWTGIIGSGAIVITCLG